MEKSTVKVTDDTVAQVASSNGNGICNHLNVQDADSTPSPGPVFFSSYVADAFPSYPLDDSEEPASTVFSEPIPAVSTSCKPWLEKKEGPKREKESAEKNDKDEEETVEEQEEEEEEGQLPMNSTYVATPRNPPPSTPLHTHRKRKSKHPSETPNSKKAKQKKYIPETVKKYKDDDIWDDTEIMEAWNRGIKKFRKQQRGEPITDSEQEVEVDNEGPGSQEEDEACEVSESMDHKDATIDETKRTIVQPLFHTMTTTNPSTEHISDSELLEHISTSWYWAGYYMGVYKERQSSARMQL